MKTEGANKKINIFYFCLIAGSASFLFFQMQKERLPSQLASAQIDQAAGRIENMIQETGPAQNLPAIVKKNNAFPLDIKAEAALSILIPLQDSDISGSKILFKKNADKKLPIASISKLMAAAVAIDNYPLSDRITISQEALSAEGDGGKLNIGEDLTVNNLLYIMLIESSNDAAEALAEKIGRERFLALMNQKARDLEMEDTSFISPNGLDPYDLSLFPNMSSALDLAKLMIHIQKNYPLIPQILSSKDLSLISPDGRFSHYLVNTNVLLYQPETLWGKTGYTKKANGCIVNLIKPKENDDHLIVNVILGADDRFYEMQKMTDWVDVSYIWQ